MGLGLCKDIRCRICGKVGKTCTIICGNSGVICCSEHTEEEIAAHRAENKRKYMARYAIWKSGQA